MRALLLVAVLAPGISLAEGAPTCAEVTKDLYGISLGPMRDYPAGLRNGLRREGTAQFIEDVGFESLEGKTDEIAYPRIMAFFDRGQFTGTVAISRVVADEDHGFARIVAAVAAAAHSTPKLVDGRATFECEDSIELSVEPVKWDDGPAIKVRAMDSDAHAQTNAYMKAYCADPKRRRPQDACTK